MSATEYLRHILEEARYLSGRTAELTWDDFMDDTTLQRAFVRSLEIIGEATKKLTPEWREAHPEIVWRAMAAMRDRLHGYFGVDYEIVWDAAATKAEELSRSVEKLIEEEGDAPPRPGQITYHMSEPHPVTAVSREHPDSLSPAPVAATGPAEIIRRGRSDQDS